LKQNEANGVYEMTKRNEPGYDLSRLYDIFGGVPLLKGEDRKKFKILQAAVQQALCPEDLFEAIDAREITSAIWDAQLYQKMFQKLVDSNRRKALENLTNFDASDAQQAAIESLGDEFYSNASMQAEVLKKLGFSQELLQARSMGMAREELPLFERLIANRIATRKAHVKDYERRKRSRAKRNGSDDEEHGESKGAFGKRPKDSS
jgi:hypothetical protein